MELDQLILALDKHLFNAEQQQYGVMSDLIGDDLQLKTMSYGGKQDIAMADIYEQWLKENAVAYIRNGRHFTIKAQTFLKALIAWQQQTT